MTDKNFGVKILAVVLIWIFAVSAVVQARPMNEFFGSDEKTDVRKLPPVHYVRSRDYDMRHIALDLKFDWEKEQAIGVATLTLAPLMPNFQSVQLDAGSMIINSVKLGGKDLKFAYDEPNTNLTVELDRVYGIGEALTLTIDYRTKGGVIANTLGFGGGGGLKFIKPDANNPNRRRQIWSQGESDYNRFWFPSYDSPNDFATTELTATVEKQMFVVSNGKLVERKENADKTATFHWKMDTPHANYLTSIVVGEYSEVKGNYLDVPVSTYLFPNEVKDGAVSVKRLPEMVKFFSEKTGVKFPYAKYAQTVAEGFSGGMENISATTMTPTLVHDERELLDGDSESLQSHELAHQWFGDYVTCREWSEIWLNESFATYMQSLWDEHSKGHEYFLYSDVQSNQQNYLDTWNQGNRRPIVTKYYTDADALFDTYAYPRGGAVLHMLRKHLGDEMFFKSLNHYLTKNANSPVQTEQLRIAIEETTGQSMDWFFDQWLYKMGHPIFEITKNYDSAAKKLTLNVKQTQKVDPLNEYPQVQYFQARVDVEIDGRVEQVWLKPQAENVFTFDSPTEPKLVNFDYEDTMIKEVKFDKSNEELAFQLKNDKDLLGRFWALRQLAARKETVGKTGSDEVKKTLLDAAANESLWQMRRDALDAALSLYTTAGATPPLNDAEITNALVNATKDKNSNVRAFAISRLGRQKDAKYADLYLGALKDQSYGVLEAAVIALGQTGDGRAYTELVNLTGTASWHDRVRLAGLQGLAALGDKRGVDLAFKFLDKSYSNQVHSAAFGVLAASGKNDPRIYPLLLENFKQSLENNNIQGIFGALQTFISLGDPRGQEAFDLAKAKFKDQSNFLGFTTRLESRFKKAIEPK